MPETATIRSRIDPAIKEEAEAVLQAIGLSTSDAFRLMMVRIAREKKLPFEPLIPNQATIDAMLSARRGQATKVASPKKLFEELKRD